MLPGTDDPTPLRLRLGMPLITCESNQSCCAAALTSPCSASGTLSPGLSDRAEAGRWRPSPNLPHPPGARRTRSGGRIRGTLYLGEEGTGNLRTLSSLRQACDPYTAHHISLNISNLPANKAGKFTACVIWTFLVRRNGSTRI